MSKSNNSYALITGASKGLGKAYALELAKRKTNLILVSLPAEGLKDLAEQLKEKGCDAIAYETDLTLKENILKLTRWVNNNYNIHILINNAGFGGDNHFLEVDMDYIDQMIQLNVKATSLITHQLLPNLLEQQKSYVLNVSSMAAWTPIAYKTVYPASKAFIHSFTRGLQQEFLKTTVSFSVVNPGPMQTNGNVTARNKELGKSVQLLLIPPEEVASISIDGMFKEKPVIKLNFMHRLGWFLLQILPVPVKISILSRKAKKGTKKLPAHEGTSNRS